MRREVDISPDHLLPDNNVRIVEVDENNRIKVVEVEESKEAEEASKKGAGAIVFLLASTLAAMIIIGTATLIYKKENKIDNATNISTNINNERKVNNSTKTEETKEDHSAITFEEPTTEEETEVNNNIERKELTVDYSNVGTFYNHIIDNRNKYGKFAESFQTEEDVKNFINFLYKFDELYDNQDIQTTIDSQDFYDKIIQDYYGSCASKGVKGELNLLYSNNQLAQQKIAEAEALAYDLKNGTGKDYTIANRYYTWFLVNLIDDRTMVDRTTNNAPFIDALREQFEQYRYSGNMLNARKYQKNDSLPVDSIHLYYADEAPEDVEVTETENSLTCPDWGVDNVISKYEEDTEKKLYIKRDNQGTFKTIDDEFEIVLNKGKVR